MQPICWTIAGSDSGGGAGIQADLHTFHDFGVFGCSAITALTAQNSVQVKDIVVSPPKMLEMQLDVLKADLPARAIKLGMLGDKHSLLKLNKFLSDFSGFVVCDPVMISSTGQALFSRKDLHDLIKLIFPRTDLLTPNRQEAEFILGRKISNPAEIQKAARDLQAMGAKQVLLKGGHGSDFYSHDYFLGEQQACWLSHQRINTDNNHGAGCTLSSAIVAAIALDYSLLDALVIARMYVHQGLRCAKRVGQGPGPVAHMGWPSAAEDLPWLSFTDTPNERKLVFPDCGPEPIGLYPVVNSCDWMVRLLSLGVTTIQLRLKDLTTTQLQREIKEAIAIAKNVNARLFINDHWQLAIELGAYGVHLGQEDLHQADIAAIHKAGLRLGISTHCHSEVARAHALAPSYIACGPIFPTTSKEMTFAPQGINALRQWCQMLNYPVVAIGGIGLNEFDDVLGTGVSGIALISALLSAKHPEQVCSQMLDRIEHAKQDQPAQRGRAKTLSTTSEFA